MFERYREEAQFSLQAVRQAVKLIKQIQSELAAGYPP